MAYATMIDEHAEAVDVVMGGIYRDDDDAREVARREIERDYEPVYSRKQSRNNCEFLCAAHHEEVM